jgi:hypothetical protein
MTNPAMGWVPPTDAPVTDAPVTDAPAVTDAPVTDAPILPPTDAPVVPPTLAPVVPPTNLPTLAPVVPPTNPPTPAPVVPPTNPPTPAPVVLPTLAPAVPPTNPPTLPPNIIVDIDFTNGFCVDPKPFQLNGNFMPLYPQYTDAANCPLRLTKECLTHTRSSAYLEVDLCNMNEFSASFTYRIYSGWDDEDGCLDVSTNDGLAFVIHQDSRGVNALGGDGPDLGVYDVDGSGGTANALVIEMDPWKNSFLGFPNGYLDNSIKAIHVITTNSQGQLTERFETECGSHLDAPRTINLSYDGTYLTIDGCSRQHVVLIDLNSIFNGPRVYMGFAGATGPFTATQEIWNWSFRQECS